MNSSWEAPAQFVSSSSCKCRSWMMLDRPLDVSSGHPARLKTCRFRIEHRCCRPKSRIWEHHRRNRAFRDIIVEMYPTPMSVMWMHLKCQNEKILSPDGGLKQSSNLSSVSSSSIFKSHAIYSSAASVIRGHHDKSRARSFCRFSAINSTPSSVILEQPDNDKTVKCGNEWTEKWQT